LYASVQATPALKRLLDARAADWLTNYEFVWLQDKADIRDRPGTSESSDSDGRWQALPEAYQVDM
jgi:hypothetical protein